MGVRNCRILIGLCKHSHKKKHSLETCARLLFMYCKTFPLVPDSTECTKFFLPKSAVHYSYYLKSNNIIGPRKTTNIQKQFYLELISFI